MCFERHIHTQVDTLLTQLQKEMYAHDTKMGMCPSPGEVLIKGEDHTKHIPTLKCLTKHWTPIMQRGGQHGLSQRAVPSFFLFRGGGMWWKKLAMLGTLAQHWCLVGCGRDRSFSKPKRHLVGMGTEYKGSTGNVTLYWSLKAPSRIHHCWRMRFLEGRSTGITLHPIFKSVVWLFKTPSSPSRSKQSLPGYVRWVIHRVVMQRGSPLGKRVFRCQSPTFSSGLHWLPHISCYVQNMQFVAAVLFSIQIFLQTLKQWQSQAPHSR